MPVQRVGSDRQDDVRSGTNGKHQQESRRMPNARRIETVRPLAAWNRREHSLSLGARQLALKRGVELTDDVGEQHQTIFPAAIGHISLLRLKTRRSRRSAELEK